MLRQEATKPERKKLWIYRRPFTIHKNGTKKKKIFVKLNSIIQWWLIRIIIFLNHGRRRIFFLFLVLGNKIQQVNSYKKKMKMKLLNYMDNKIKKENGKKIFWWIRKN